MNYSNKPLFHSVSLCEIDGVIYEYDFEDETVTGVWHMFNEVTNSKIIDQVREYHAAWRKKHQCET